MHFYFNYDTFCEYGCSLLYSGFVAGFMTVRSSYFLYPLKMKRKKTRKWTTMSYIWMVRDLSRCVVVWNMLFNRSKLKPFYRLTSFFVLARFSVKRIGYFEGCTMWGQHNKRWDLNVVICICGLSNFLFYFSRFQWHPGFIWVPVRGPAVDEVSLNERTDCHDSEYLLVNFSILTTIVNLKITVTFKSFDSITCHIETSKWREL